MDTLSKILEALESLMDVIGHCEIHGYTNDSELFEVLENSAQVCEFKKNYPKKLSIHATFSGKYFDRNDLKKHFGGNTVVTFNGFKLEHDPVIYCGNGAQHVFRHMSSNAYMLEGRKIKLTKENAIDRKLFTFQNLKNALITASPTDEFMKCEALKSVLKFDIPNEKKVPTQEIVQENVQDEYFGDFTDGAVSERTMELFRAIISGILQLPNGTRLHGDAGGKSIKDELTEFTLFSQLFGLQFVGVPIQDIEEAIESITDRKSVV